MAAGNSVFQLQHGAGRMRGLDNLLRAELTSWFGTRRWWSQILIWAAIVNLSVLGAAMQGVKEGAALVTIFGILLGVAAPFGVCALMQGAIVGEKESGTAAWVLSRPVSRTAFVVAKLVANTVGITATILLAQGLLAYGVVYLAAGKPWPWLAFVSSLGVHLAHLFFYITLTLMLGALSSHRGPVIGLPLALLFAQYMLRDMFPSWVEAFPVTLTLPLGTSEASAPALAVMLGQTPQSYLALATTLTASALFIAVAVWAFERQEV
jgi:ABC-2 type transport system permease protein